MLTHKQRFHGHGSLRYLFSKGKSVRSRHLQLRYVTNKTRLHSRFAVVVSKKVSKRAVYRNRIRRRIFEVIRTEFTDLDTAWDVSITVFSSEAITLPADELKAEVMQLLVSAGMTQK